MAVSSVAALSNGGGSDPLDAVLALSSWDNQVLLLFWRCCFVVDVC
jgi:hypothetical protein